MIYLCKINLNYESHAYRIKTYQISLHSFLVSVVICQHLPSESAGVSQAEALKEENDSLRCQLDAYRNEVELLKQEQGRNQPISSEDDSVRAQQLSFLQQALQSMQRVSRRLTRQTESAKEICRF